MDIKHNLGELQRYLEKVRDDSFFNEADGNEIGERLHDLVMAGFDRSEDPYGRAWPGISHREGKPLLDTFNMVSSIDYDVTRRSNGLQVSIGTDVEYAPVHNIGLGHVRQRMFIPTNSNKLPASYNNVIINVITKKLERAIQ
ncbi:hypothetical protein HNO53_12920 [Billgrantia antri]|uniref:Virion morphogenesis protein n=1 Tax=Halomonas sulfidivorans TaxID=2733488 RepID=A0ABX7WGP6_9GAMM|nr:phage virion morphogenesis protein [Halomonas sulfidivorans]QTP59538.1 hypothetical protein HNO53_12920 [Halomonas sulfidivorans]